MLKLQLNKKYSFLGKSEPELAASIKYINDFVYSIMESKKKSEKKSENDLISL